MTLFHLCETYILLLLHFVFLKIFNNIKYRAQCVCCADVVSSSELDQHHWKSSA